MSQMRVLARELRAVLSTAIVCALVFGLVFSNVAQAARSAGAPNAAGKVGAYALCLEHLAHRAPAETRIAPASKTDGSDRLHCPDCCLAAHAAAVLPERFAAVAHPVPDRPSQSFHAWPSARASDSSPTSTVNGARAPPALL